MSANNEATGPPGLKRKRERSGGHQVRRSLDVDLLANEVRESEMLLDVLNNLNVEIERLRQIFDPQIWLPNLSVQHGSSTSRPKPTLPSLSRKSLTSIPQGETRSSPSANPQNHSRDKVGPFAAALKALEHGNQAIEASAAGLSQAQALLSSKPLALRRSTRATKGRKEARPANLDPSGILPATEDVLPSESFPKKSSRSPLNKASRTSPFFPTDPFRMSPVPAGLCFKLQPGGYGLIQERIRGNLFALLVQAILWNQTRGKEGRPVLFELLLTYPTPETLANADVSEVIRIIGRLGLQNIRSARLIALAQAWVASPPCATRRYGKRNYPLRGDNTDVRNGELLGIDDHRTGWEVAHLPGIGAYALDSYRIFHRDTLGGVEEGDGMEPEWKRVVPLDKDLRPYLVWRWKEEGWDWDFKTGKKTRMRLT